MMTSVCVYVCNSWYLMSGEDRTSRYTAANRICRAGLIGGFHLFVKEKKTECDREHPSKLANNPLLVILFVHALQHITDIIGMLSKTSHLLSLSSSLRPIDGAVL
jgi:hypothetical protein